MSSRILIVDDEPALRDVLADALAGAGYASGAAPDGETALARLAAERFDLVVLDVVLPRTGGLEVCRESCGSVETTLPSSC